MIQSSQNRHYKRWRRFAAAPENDDCPWIPVEGIAQVSELAERLSPELVIYCPELCLPPAALKEKAGQSIALPKRLFLALSDVKTSQGILAFFPKPDWHWQDITPSVLYLDRLQDPGNLGTLLRTAAATGLFSVITSPGTVSCFKKKVVRSSAGYLFEVPFLQGVELSSLAERSYRLFAAFPKGGRALAETKFEPPFALIIGSESKGVQLPKGGYLVEPVSIPMPGNTESLNAAVSGSIVMYEIIRRKYL